MISQQHETETKMPEDKFTEEDALGFAEEIAAILVRARRPRDDADSIAENNHNS